MTELIAKYRPDCISVEKLYFNTNTTTAIAVAEARGCILLAAKKVLCGLRIHAASGQIVGDPDTAEPKKSRSWK